MKKILSFLLIITMLLVLEACGATNRAPEDTSDPSSDTTSGTPTEAASEPDSSEPSSSETQPDSSAPDTEPADPASDPSAEETPSEPADSSPRVLVAFFSATGTTKKMAGYIADCLEADLYEILPAEPYTSEDLSYNNDCRANREMNDETCRPEISGSVENMADYDVIFLGYPIWWGEAPRILSTFVESYDFTGKTVVTFCTSGSSPNDDSAIQALAEGADWISGTRLDSGSSQSDVADWIDGLDLDLEG